MSRFRLLFVWTSFVLLALFPFSLLAQQVDEVVVTATRLSQSLSQLPFSADVIDADEIVAARPLLGLDESLQRVPGLQIQNRFNFAQDLRISMRGFGARSAFGIRGIRIVVDGIPETLPDGQSGVDGIDLGAARRIEVLRGGASVIYGNAAGGVILIDSALGADPDAVFAAAAYGADGYRRLQAGVEGTAGNLGYYASVNDLSVDGFRQHSEARNRQATLRLNHGAGTGRDWLFSLHHTDQPLAKDPGGVTRASYDNDPRAARDRNVLFNAGEVLERTRLGLRYRHTAAGGWQWQGRMFNATQDFLARLPFEDGGIVDLVRRFSGAGLQLTRPLTIGGMQARWHIGVDIGRQRDDRRRFDNDTGEAAGLVFDQLETVTSAGAFSQLEVATGEDSDLTIGLRYDDLRFDVEDRFFIDGDDSGRRNFSRANPVIGWSWRFAPGFTAFANTSQSFEAPTTTELANPEGGGFNTQIGPALAWHREAGLRRRATNGEWSISAYAIDIDDELLPFELASAPGRDFFRNSGSTDRRGLEWAWSRRLTQQWSARLMHTWSDFRFDRFQTEEGDDFSANRTPGNARYRSFAAMQYHKGDGRFAELELVRFGRIALNNANTAFSDSYTLINVRGSWRLQYRHWQYEPFFAVSNLTGVDYASNTRINAFGGRYFEAGPDRSVYVGVNVRRQSAKRPAKGIK